MYFECIKINTLLTYDHSPLSRVGVWVVMASAMEIELTSPPPSSSKRLTSSRVALAICLPLALLGSVLLVAVYTPLIPNPFWWPMNRLADVDDATRADVTATGDKLGVFVGYGQSNSDCCGESPGQKTQHKEDHFMHYGEAATPFTFLFGRSANALHPSQSPF